MRLVPLLVLIIACGTEEVPRPAGGSPTTTPTAPATTPPEACSLDLPGSDSSPLDPACSTSPVAAPWSAVLEQRLGEAAPEHTPVVGHLDDDDGDGFLGSGGDVPDIVGVDRFSGTWGAKLAVWSGGTLLWRHDHDYHRLVTPLIADLDGDGEGEIVAGGDGFLSAPIVVLDGQGDELWRTDPLDLECVDDEVVCATAALDLDGDGTLEIVVDGWIIDGVSGAVDAVLDVDTSFVALYRGLATVDLDGDGAVELVIGDRVFDAGGSLLWTVGAEPSRSAMPTAAQLDDDPEPEVAIARDRHLWLVDGDGTVLATVPIPGSAGEGWAGPPCAGDLDGDGLTEIVVSGGSTIDAFTRDGVRLWSAPMTGWGTGMRGCATHDLDGDGADEVVFGDALGLRILDGTSGTTRWGTVEYAAYATGVGPIVADVDADGAAEIVAASTGHILNPYNWIGVQVYGHDGAGWPLVSDAAPDLRVEVTDSCACDDDAPVELAATVSNEGALGASEARLQVLADDELLEEIDLGPIAAGTRAAAVEVRVDRAVLGERALQLRVVGADGCDPDDDVAVFEASCD